MGFFSRLFGKLLQPSGPPPEVIEIFERMKKFLEDESLQNSSLPPRQQQMLEAGGAVDVVPGAEGEFGRDQRNPIPVNGSIGELIYLAHLITETGSRVFGHRLGSIGNIDVYETLTLDGTKWDLLFFDLYHTRRSRKSPGGYHLEPQPLLTAANYAIPNFPVAAYDAIRECVRGVVGMPCTSPALGAVDALHAVKRSPSHKLALESLHLTSRAQGFIRNE